MRAVLLLAVAWGATAQTIAPSTAAPTSSPTPAASPVPPVSTSWSFFSEAGAAAGNNLAGGLGIAMDAAANQQVFGEIQMETGKLPAGQATSILFGDKSNYPAITVKGRKVTPFSIVAYGASIDTLKTIKFAPPSAGLSATSITQFGTSAGLAQRYGAGFETLVRSWTVGFGYSLQKTGMGWGKYPFVYFGRAFGK